MSSAETPADPITDERTQALLDELTGALGDGVVGSEQRAGDLWVRVTAEAWRPAGEACQKLGFDYFCFLSGIDWMPSAPNAEDAEAASVEPDADADDAPDAEAAATEPKARAQFSSSRGPSGPDSGEEEAQPSPAGAEATEATTPDEPAAEGWETGYAGGETRFQVFARVYSTRRKQGVTLKADLDDDHPRVDSWVSLYRGADWHERETWEMYGFVFVGHPGLRHLYLPGAFEGFPLRKDFPLLSREVKPWPGLVDVEPMPEPANPHDDADAGRGFSGEPEAEAEAGAEG